MNITQNAIAQGAPHVEVLDELETETEVTVVPQTSDDLVEVHIAPPVAQSNEPLTAKQDLSKSDTTAIGFPQQLSTRVAFFIAGTAMAAWAPLVPYAKSRMGLNEATLGLLLLFLGAGSTISMPLIGGLLGRIGCRTAATVASISICLLLPFLVLSPNVVTLAIVLFLFGTAIGSVDVAGNVQAVIVEKASGRAMMSGFHGMFSLGGIIGAGTITGLLALGVSPLVSTLCIAALILALIAGFSKNLLSYGSQSKEPLFVKPHGKVIFIGVLCFLACMAEGSMLDWSALFLTSLRGLDESLGGLGYAIFAVAMTTGRITGDRVINAIGKTNAVLFGSLLACAGLFLAVLIPSAATTLTGFVLIGLGLSNIIPVLFGAAGNNKDMPGHLALAATATIGHAGILVGPAFIGFLAHATSLPITFVVVAILMLVVTANAKRVTQTS